MTDAIAELARELDYIRIPDGDEFRDLDRLADSLQAALGRPRDTEFLALSGVLDRYFSERGELDRFRAGAIQGRLGSMARSCVRELREAFEKDFGNARNVEVAHAGWDGERQVIDLVLKGGGAKGVGYVGAIEVLQAAFCVRTYAGTSAGAIAASLFSLGAGVKEVRDAVSQPMRLVRGPSRKPAQVAFSDVQRLFRGEPLFDNGEIISWLDERFRMALRPATFPNRSGYLTFADVMPHARAGLLIFASDPHGGLKRFGFVVSGESRTPVGDGSAAVAHAVAASMAIPAVFPAVRALSSAMLDGGLLANFPVDEAEQILREARVVPNVLGLTLIEGTRAKPGGTTATGGAVLDAVSAITDGRNSPETDRLHRDGRLVAVHTGPIGTLDLHLSPADASALSLAGRGAALEYVASRAATRDQPKAARLFDGDNTQTWADAQAAGREDATAAENQLSLSSIARRRPKWALMLLAAACLRYWYVTLPIALALIALGGGFGATAMLFRASLEAESARTESGTTPRVPHDTLREQAPRHP